MMSFDVRSNVADVIRQTHAFSRDVRERATHYALTATAMDVKAAEVATMQRVFHAPTRWTLNSLFVRAATRQTQTAQVFFRDFAPKGVPAGKYLFTQIHGGTRKQKSHEKSMAPYMQGRRFSVPGPDARTDAHGNVAGKTYTQILSMLKVSRDPLQNATGSKRSKRSQAKNRFFAAGPNSHLTPGIYQTQGARGLKAVLLFTSNMHYRPRFPFYETAARVAHATFKDHFYRELIESARRSFHR